MRRAFDPTDKAYEGRRTWIGNISRFVSDYNNLAPMYALTVMVAILIGFTTLPMIQYDPAQLYPKEIPPGHPLNPYERGGEPFTATKLVSQYPENSLAIGYIASYVPPLFVWFAKMDLHVGTLAHPGGIIDELIYYLRGIDTIAETSIFFVSFAIASFLFRRREAP